MRFIVPMLCAVLPAAAPPGEVALRFGMRRNGGIVGRPHIAFARLPTKT